MEKEPALARSLTYAEYSRLESEPTIPVLQRYKTMHTLGRVVSATGICEVMWNKIKFLLIFVSIRNRIPDEAVCWTASPPVRICSLVQCSSCGGRGELRKKLKSKAIPITGRGDL
jgi:hypothetical protein